MDVRYQRDMNHNYLVVPCEEGLDEKSYETRMIFANKIPGLLSCHIRYIDGKTYLGYDVTSRQSLSFFCENRKPGRKEIQNILGSIFETISGMEEYLLCPDHLILNPEFILLSFDTQEAELAFAPFFTRDIRTSLRETVEYLLSFTAHDDRRGIVLGYRLSHELLEGNTGISQLMDILYEREGQEETEGREEKKEKITKNVGVGEWSGSEEMPACPEHILKEPEDPAHDEIYERGKRRDRKKHLKRIIPVILAGAAVFSLLFIAIHWSPEVFRHFDSLPVRVILAVLVCSAAVYAGMRMKAGKRREPEGRNNRSNEGPSDFSGSSEKPVGTQEKTDERMGLVTDDYRPDGRQADGRSRKEDLTTLLSGERDGDECSDVLVPEDPEQDLPVIPLGLKEMLIGKNASCVQQVIDSPAVSRLHARIRKGEDGYYLRDLNSTNGTTVNGKAVFGDTEVLLSEGDRILFADVAYIMRCTPGV